LQQMFLHKPTLPATPAAIQGYARRQQRACSAGITRRRPLLQ